MGAVDTIEQSLKSSRAISATAYDRAISNKSSSGIGSALTPSFGNVLSDWQNQSRDRNKYELFSGWLYSAIDAHGHKAASQPIQLVKRKGKAKNQKPGIRKSMTTSISQKATKNELEIIEDHPILDALHDPNPIQGRWQFIYSFIANLCLTGWAYVVKDEDEQGNLQFYSLPTTWIKPDHKNGPFSRFKIGDPNKPESQNDEDFLDRSQVGFAHLPNPADPRTAYAPASAQMPAIRINDHIQTGRERFFRAGVFPSVIVTMGRDPHPEVPGGIRPRLSDSQKRQVNTMIKRTMGGVANYGNPAIVDGMIESIERLSMTDNEMGWEKSEDSVKKSILSAFCVNSFILGETMNVGGYAQATIIKQLFYDRVNSYLDLFSGVLTNLVNQIPGYEDLLVWLEKCEAVDRVQRNQMIKFARGNNDISQNEIRELLGLAPDEDMNQSVIGKSNVNAIVKLLEDVGNGIIENTQAIAMLKGLGLPTDMAVAMAGPKVEKPVPSQQPAQLQQGQEVIEEDGKKPPKEDNDAEKTLRESIAELRRVQKVDPDAKASLISNMISGWRK